MDLPRTGRFGETGDGCAAARFERGEQRPFRVHGGPAARVVHCGQNIEQPVVGPALDRQRALCGRRQEYRRVEDLGGFLNPAEPGQAGSREHDRVQLALGDLAQPGVHVAADRYRLDRQAERAELGDAAHGTGADARAGGKLRKGPADQGIPGVFPRRYRRDQQPLGRCGRQVLVRVDRDVDLLGQQGIA